MATREYHWVHLLSVHGEAVDYRLIQEALSTVDHYHLGGHCWLIQSLQDRDSFFARIEAACASTSGAYEALYCPVADAYFLRCRVSGPGLHEWMKKQGPEHILDYPRFT